jgi:hypothetical protein
MLADLGPTDTRIFVNDVLQSRRGSILKHVLEYPGPTESMLDCAADSPIDYFVHGRRGGA